MLLTDQSNKKNGFTLIEMIVTLVILIILTTMATTNYQQMVETSESNHIERRLKTPLNHAKKFAQLHRQIIVVCGSTNQKTCSTDWSKGYLTFIDSNNNNQFNDLEKIIDSQSFNLKYGTIKTTSSNSQKTYRFRATVGTPISYGSLYYCNDKKPNFNTGIIMSKLGNIRKAQDTNADGVPEDATGQAISCS